MKIDGRCHCGAIVYVADVDPESASICHCADCQTFSGAPFRGSVAARAEDFRILSGQAKIYVKTGDSGRKRAQGFCGDCGTPIYTSDAKDPKMFNLRLGAVKQREKIFPRRQIWTHSALRWALDVKDLPASPGEWA